MKTIRIYDTWKGTDVAYAKSEKQAKHIMYALSREDRENGYFDDGHFEIIIGQSDRRINRRNKQARRAYEQLTGEFVEFDDLLKSLQEV